MFHENEADAPVGIPLEDEFFLAATELTGEPDELAKTLALKLRSFNALGPSNRKLYLAPHVWEVHNHSTHEFQLWEEDSVYLELVGEIDYLGSNDLKEEWIEDCRHKSAVTTHAIASFLEKKLGLPFDVRPLTVSNLDDCALIDSFRNVRRRSHNSQYPNVEDLISAGKQEQSLIGDQGSYAYKSPYFSVTLHTKDASDELAADALSAASKMLYRKTGIRLFPREVFQLEDKRFELRMVGCYENSRDYRYRATYWIREREYQHATGDMADPIAYFLDVTVEELRLFETTAANRADLAEAQRVADEIDLTDLPEPEDFIVLSREEVLAADARREQGLGKLERASELTGEQELDALIGLKEEKRQVREFIKFAQAQKERGGKMPHLHMCFRGNPGTGKTTLARIIGHMMCDAGLLPKRNVFVETSGIDFRFEDIRKARRGILFIDEAYSLMSVEIAKLVKSMEDCHQNYARDGFIVIFAGYPRQIDAMISKNPGLRDRIGVNIDFEDYSCAELMQIIDGLAASDGYGFDEDAHALLSERIRQVELLKDQNFANGRLMRTIFERMQIRQATFYEADPVFHVKTVEDFFENEFAELVGARCKSKEAHQTSPELSGDEQLDRLIGLTKTKAQIKEFLDYAAVQKERGGVVPRLHMCFKGNPGTGKTTLARIIGEMMYDRNLLPSRERFVECDRQALVGPYVGWTAPATGAQINKARHGVLFIDEAYALDGKSDNDFGKEALAVLVKEMEDCRANFEKDGFVCIMAGYSDLMDEMISLNPGLRDRFGLIVDFDDYTADELMEIFELLMKDENYRLSKAARPVLAEYLDRVVEAKTDDFSNARLIEKVFERIKMRQAIKYNTNSCIKRDVVDDVFADGDLIKLITSPVCDCKF